MNPTDEPLVHCWENGPQTDDGCSTTCMLLNGHAGQHEWTRDDEIGISFAPALKTADREGSK